LDAIILRLVLNNCPAQLNPVTAVKRHRRLRAEQFGLNFKREHGEIRK